MHEWVGDGGKEDCASIPLKHVEQQKYKLQMKQGLLYHQLKLSQLSTSW